MSRGARIAALALLLAFFFVLGRDTASAPVQEPPAPDYSTYDAAQLSWVIEGTMERISELQDDLKELQAIQREKLARPP